MGKEKNAPTGLRKVLRVVLITYCFSLFVLLPVPQVSSSAQHQHAATLVNKTSGNWSDSGIWNLGRVPAAGDDVKIASDTNVTYDVSNETDIKSVIVEGALIFSQSKDTNLDTGRLIVMDDGFLQIGTEENPLPPNITARIRLTENAIAGEDHEKEMYGAFMVMGRVELHGATKQPTFTKLAEPALKGQESITLAQAPTGWGAGDEIVLGGDSGESETATMAGISGNIVRLTAPLVKNHPVISYTSPIDGATFKFQADAGNLTRNIKIVSKYPDTARGHTLVMDDGRWHLSYVEYRHLGGIAEPGRRKLMKPLLGRYGVHFHKLGTVSKVKGKELTAENTVYVKGVSIVDTQNHALRIHGTDRVLVEDNVVYSTLGHSFDIGEDGSEMENVIRHNLVVKAQSAGSLTGEFFEQNKNAVGFWFGNMGQIVEDNVASDVGRGYGMYKIRPTPPNRLLGGSVEPNEIPIKHFVNNEVYGCTAATRLYHFIKLNEDMTIQGLKAWNCRRGTHATTGKGSDLTWDNVILANFQSEAAVLSPGQTLKNSRVIARFPDSTEGGQYGVIIEGNTEVVGTIIEGATEAAIKGVGRNNIVQDSVLSGVQPFLLPVGGNGTQPSDVFIEVKNYEGSRTDLPDHFKLIPQTSKSPAPGCVEDQSMKAWVCSYEVTGMK